MRICLLSPHYPPDLSGLGDYTYFLAGALANLGHEIEVVASVGDFDENLYPATERVRVHRVVKSWRVRGLPQVLRTVRETEADALVIQYTPHAYDRRGITLAVNLVPLFIRLTTRIRVVVNFHEIFLPFDRSLRHSLGAVWQRFMALVIATPCHALTAITSEWPTRLRRVGIRKPIQVIPVGSNIPLAEVAGDRRQALREGLGVDENMLLIGGLGSVGRDRDIGLLFRAFAILRQFQRAKLIWLGAPRLDPEGLKRVHQAVDMAAATEDVVWTGTLPHPQLSRMMTACDLFVLPFADGISTKRGTLAAALLHGLPVLATKGTRLERVFVHGVNAYLVPLGEPPAFINGLCELARCPELRARISSGGRALHDAHFAWDVIARQVAISL